MNTQKLGTLAVHAGEDEVLEVPSVNVPVYLSTTYRFADAAAAEAYLDDPRGKWLYSRLENPTVLAAERKLAALEGAEAALCFASGMAAVTAALLAVLKQGDLLLVSDALYGESLRLCRDVLAKFGVEVRSAPIAGLAQAVEEAPSNARALLFETPANPMARVADVPAVANACRRRGLTSILDATFATPVNLRPLSYGVDLVLHSATKYLNGHSDHLAGVVAGGKALVAEVEKVRRSTGANLDPAVAYDLVRGVKTLEVRVLRQNETALQVARALEGHPKVARVSYPMLPSHPDHALAKRLLRGGGGVLAFSAKGGYEAICRVHDALRIVARASSLGGVESLASIPVISSHRHATHAELAAAGIDRGTLRLSVGLEDPEDLVADLLQALERA
ncbi:trans-sulfuration enzyme family protein [Anaeromyxobacter paludicola]|uniref:Methionine gamma-lyase n=1 Tax=Anaeromyxobacter paludicola TaxID=2918171 RepID=A0ABM7XBW8_9BACT|nr:aminotransferase class I/II-fold pyridoxal phosphate-dependent enzyme [Anaeromyxobacter paludicola]BDG09354.1 methionine gamma-lyase [Anaeromyxobacter paludicola]